LDHSPANRSNLPVSLPPNNFNQSSINRSNLPISQPSGDASNLPVNQSQNVAQSSETNLSSNFQKSTAKEIMFAPLPFYDIEKELIEPKVLTPYWQTYDRKASSSISFQVSSEFINCLSYSVKESLPRYEIQLRMAFHNPGKEQIDEFPVNAKIMMNGIQVILPPFFKVPGRILSKRESQPVNISTYCNRKYGASQKLEIEWQNDSQKFVIGIWFVHHIDFNILRARFLDSGKSHYNETKEMIQRKMNSHDEEGISMDTLKISLICPLTRSKMVTSVRSQNCLHIQCFDLSSYLRMNESRPKWKCPICNKACPVDSLVVDRYFAEILENTDVSEVELMTDGTWKVVDKKEALDLTVNGVNPIGNSTIRNSSKTEIVTIEDDDFVSTPEIQPILTNEESNREQLKVKETDFRGIPIITLSDSDD